MRDNSIFWLGDGGKLYELCADGHVKQVVDPNPDPIKWSDWREPEPVHTAVKSYYPLDFCK